MTAPPRVLAITGGTGFVGGALIERALADGHAVRALARRTPPPLAGVEWIPGDLADRAALARLTRGATAVIHVAGAVNAPDAAGFEAANVAGTGNVLAAAAAGGARRLVFVSSLAAREPALSIYGGSKARAEALVARGGLDWTIVRPPAIYGPRDRELLELFRAAARLGVVPVPGRGRASLLHVDDLARLLLALAPADARAARATFEPDDGTRGGWEHGELARAIGEAVGRRPRVPRLSRRLLGLAARADRLARGHAAKLTPDRARYLSHPDWVASPAARVPPELWTPRIATRDGLAATARWYREQGWL